MNEFMQNFFGSFIRDLGPILLKIAIIVLIMLVLLEILKTFKILAFINKILYYVFKPLGITRNACAPLVVGLFAGITYGASAILASYASNDLTKKDVILVSTFLCLCHAVIEDTILFVSIGATGIVILLVRFGIALIVTYSMNLIMKASEKRRVLRLKEEKTGISLYS